jgi:hypothetical protein
MPIQIPIPVKQNDADPNGSGPESATLVLKQQNRYIVSK